MWTVQIRDQTARSLQSDLDLHCSHKASCVVISKERVKATEMSLYALIPYQITSPAR